MSNPDPASVKRQLVQANRILAHEGVVDAFGHVSVRHPNRADRYFLACSRAPELVTLDDILEFNLDNEPAAPTDRPLYLERFIHGAVYAARPDVGAVVHNHAYDVIPFGVTKVSLRPVSNTGAHVGNPVPVWDIRDRFGDTDLLVVNDEQGADLAGCLGSGMAALMRGHGCVVIGPELRRAVMNAIYFMVNARLQLAAHKLGPIRFLSDGEIAVHGAHMVRSMGAERGWQNLVSRAGCAEP